MMGLTDTVTGVGRNEEVTIQVNAAREKMEEVLAMGFSNISLSTPPGSPNALSDQVTIRGKLVSRNVIVDLADGTLPADGTVDSDFKRITVEVGSVELHTYIAADLS